MGDDATFIFADLAGFTAMTEAHGDEPAADLAEEFASSCANVAARVAGVAAGGEVLLTGKTREVAGSLAGAVFTARGSQRFKNVGEPIASHAAESEDPSSKPDWPIDPVCRMAVDPERRAGVLIHAAHEYSFCSTRCIRAFAETPTATPKPHPP